MSLLADGHASQRADPAGLLPLPSTVLAVLNGIPGMVGYWDRDLRNRLANDAYVEYFGLTPGEILGRHMRDVIGESLFGSNLPLLARVLDGENVTFDRSLDTVRGENRSVQVSYIPDVRDGAVEGFFVLVTDISERAHAERETEAALASWRALARSMPRGFVLVFDADLRFQIADGVELATFGFTRDQLEGRLLDEAMEPHLVEWLEPRYRAALAGETTQWERTLGHRTFQLTAGPVLRDDAERVSTGMVTAQDITEQRINELTWRALHTIATEIAKQATPDEIAWRIALSLCEVFHADTAAVLRYREPGVADVLAMAPEHLPTVPETVTFEPGDTSTAARVYETGEAVLASYDTAGGSIAAQVSAGGLRIGAGAPIRHNGQLWGAVVLASQRPDGFDDAVLAPLTTFANLAELALGSTESWEQLAQQAQVDELTGLANRRAFNSQLEREIERAGRRHRPLSIAIMDLDLFKNVNDTFGHAVGDAVLAEFGVRARVHARDGDLVARLGGEEFAWLMPDSDSAAAVTAAERLRALVGTRPFDTVGAITVSIGLCTVEDGMDAAQLFERADQALYLAKRGGRNRVALVGGPT